MKVFRLSVLSLVLTVSGGILALAAQNRTVSGKVLDAQQQPIVGVAVLVDGTTRGTTTSENGSFTLDIPAGEVVLNATYLGYIPQKVTVPSSKSEVTIYLQEDAIQLEEAVVIGYGTQKRVNLTGAVSTVSSKELENRVTHSVTNMLQGSVAGLNIRGVNSVNSADPLVLIDGVVGDLNRVNPNDVESISVIKDASAAAVYGARAAFGVILVTTKSGSAKDGKATVRYSYDLDRLRKPRLLVGLRSQPLLAGRERRRQVHQLHRPRHAAVAGTRERQDRASRPPVGRRRCAQRPQAVGLLR